MINDGRTEIYKFLEHTDYAVAHFRHACGFLNTAMNGNFHFVSFGCALQNDAKSVSGQ